MCWRRDFCTSLDGKCVSCCVDHGPKSLETPSLGGRVLRPSPSWHRVRREGARVPTGMPLTSPVGPPGVTIRRHSILDRKPLAFSAPTCTLPTGRGRVVRQGTSLETGCPRLRPAVTHYYSEMVTSGASLPFILEWTWACGGRFLFGVATAG